MAAAALLAAPQPKPRLWFLDNLKVALTVLVILHHVGQAYGSTGGFWYYSNPDRAQWLGFFFWVNASFFMGLFFLVSGYFVPGSYDRNGPRKFLTDRLVRFCLPILLFALIINPLMMYLSYLHFRGGSLPLLTYFTEIYLGMGAKPAGWKGTWPDLNLGHLWFVEHLLVYAALYTGWRLLADRTASGARTTGASASQTGREAPSDLALLAYALGLAGVSYLVRLSWPIDRWLGFLGFIQMEPAHLPQYASLFFLGFLAYRQNWALTMPTARGQRWLLIGIAAVLIGAAFRFGLLPGGLKSAGTFLEAFVATGLSVGLITLFRERWNRTGPLPAALTNAAYGAYLIHFPVVVACQYAAGLLPAGPFLRFLTAGAAAVFLSFTLAHQLRKIPGATRIL